MRTVRVCYRRREKREPVAEYWKKPLSKEIVPVQRLALLQACEEPIPATAADM